MSREGESGVDNYRFGLVMGVLALAMLGAWFFLHPNSPWHSRNIYVVAFPEIGTLVPGNAVLVNGQKRGEVLRTELAGDSMLWVSLEVRANVKLARDSRFKIINSGLMGERVVDIRPGNDSLWLSDGDSVKGSIDMGSTRLALAALRALRELDGIAQSAKELLDTLTAPSTQASVRRMRSKGNALIGQASLDGNAWMDSLSLLSEQLRSIQGNAQGLYEELKPGVSSLADSVRVLDSHLQALKPILSEVARRAEALYAQGEQGNVGLLLKDQALHERIGTIGRSASALLSKIEKQGMDLNVDIW